MDQELERYINDLDISINDLKNQANYYYKGRSVEEINNDIVKRCNDILDNINRIRNLSS